MAEEEQRRHVTTDGLRGRVKQKSENSKRPIIDRIHLNDGFSVLNRENNLLPRIRT